MPKTKFRFKNSTLKNRIKKNKPVWLFKWTAEGRKVGKAKKLSKDRKLPNKL